MYKKSKKELSVEEREDQGFFYFENLCRLYNLFQDKDEYEIKSCRFIEFCPYDAIVLKFDKETGSVIKRMYFEFKIRDRKFPDNKYILEQKKFNRLKKHKKAQFGDDTAYYYVNFLPDKTYMTCLDEKFVNQDLTLETKLMNKRTFESRTDKVEKKIFMIDLENDKHTRSYDYKGCPISYRANKKRMVKERNSKIERRDLSVLFDKYENNK